MKRSTFFTILLICLFSRFFCSCDPFFSHGTFGIEEISLERLSKNILDLRIHHKQVFSDGYKEKMFVYDENEELVYCLNDILKINSLQFSGRVKQALLSHPWS
jgi:hypothetical protein